MWYKPELDFVASIKNRCKCLKRDMKKLFIKIILSFLCFQSFGQTTDSIATQLTIDLEQIYSRGHINGFSVAIVNADGVVFQKG